MCNYNNHSYADSFEFRVFQLVRDDPAFPANGDLHNRMLAVYGVFHLMVEHTINIQNIFKDNQEANFFVM